jgi:hypothetical protein
VTHFDCLSLPKHVRELEVRRGRLEFFPTSAIGVFRGGTGSVTSPEKAQNEGRYFKSFRLLTPDKKTAKAYA